MGGRYACVTLTRTQVGLGRDEPNRDPRLLAPSEGRGWDDFLAGISLTWDFGPLWLRVSKGGGKLQCIGAEHSPPGRFA